MDGDAAIGRENDLCSGDELQQLGDIVRLRQDQVTNAKHGVPSR